MQPNSRRLIYYLFLIFPTSGTCFQQVVMFIIHRPLFTDYSLRNGLLIFFLLVVPIVVLVVLVLLYIFRRESLDPCLKGSLVNRLK